MVEDRIQKPFIATAEDDMIIHTMLDLEQHIGREITWVSGKTFEETIDFKGGYLPNKIARFCTTELKTIPIAEWLHENIKEDRIMRFGYRANETKRAKSMIEGLGEDGFSTVKIIVGRKNNRNKWEDVKYIRPEFPLIEDNIYKDTIELFWQDKDVRFAEMNNCVGCWWRGEVLLNKMSRLHPEKMNWFSEMEESRKGTFKTGISYKQIIAHKMQVELDFEDFSSCDTGYCGV